MKFLPQFRRGFFWAVLVLALGSRFVTVPLAAPVLPDSNVSVVGRWTRGSCWTVAARGSTIFVSEGISLDIVDWRNPEAPELLSRLTVPSPVLDLSLSGHTAYLVTSGELIAVDIRDLHSPRTLGMCALPAVPQDLEVDSAHAYVTGGSAGMFVIDVSDPTAPVQKAHVPGDGLWYRGVAVAGGYAFVAAGYPGGLRVFDVHDPGQPAEAGSLRVERELSRLAVRDSLLFGVGNPDELTIISVADPRNPELIRRFPVYGRDVRCVDSLVFLAERNAFHLVDVSDPANPKRISSYELEGRRGVKRIAVSQGRAYLSDSETGVWALDLTDLSHPALLGLYSTPGRTEKIAVGGGFVYVAGGSRPGSPRGVTVLDARNPAGPKEIGPRILSEHLILDLAWANGFLFASVGNQVDSILCLDTRKPEQPVVVGRFGPLRATALCARDSLLFAAGTDEFHREVFYVIDVHDPTAPVKVGGRLLKMPGEIWDVVVHDSLAYLARGGAGLQILSVSDPASPRRVGALDCTASAGGVAVRKGYVFVVDRYPSGLMSVIDVSDPANPVEKATYSFGKACYGIASQGPIVYVAASSRGLRVLDVRDPLRPLEVGFFDTPGLSMAVAADTSFIYVADGPCGVAILRNDVVLTAVSEPAVHRVSRNRVALESYPNPFNSSSLLTIRLARPGFVRLAVYDVRGRRVRELRSGWWGVGSHTIRWSGTDDAGRPLPSGVYLVRLEAGPDAAVQKVVLVR